MREAKTSEPTPKKPDSTPPGNTGKASRKPYRKPVLREYGDVRDAAMSPSPGTFESGLGPGFRGA